MHAVNYNKKASGTAEKNKHNFISIIVDKFAISISCGKLTI